MPPHTIRSGGRSRRIPLIAGLLVLAGLGGFTFLEIGSFLAREDALVTADAIFVLAGTRVERPMEAADLYAAAYAPRVLVTRAAAEQGMPVAERRGVRIPTDFDLSLEVLRSLGVPGAAIIAPDRVHDNTAEEAETLRAVAVEQRWRRVIVVSSKYHLRRAALACRRALRGTDVQILVRGSRYDLSTPDRWWRRRSDIRWIASELPKLVGYSLGLG